MNRAVFAAAAALLASGCGHPRQLQFDYTRAYTSSFGMQADLTRPSAANSAYPISGEEGILLRHLVIEESTDEESGIAETTL